MPSRGLPRNKPTLRTHDFGCIAVQWTLTILNHVFGDAYLRDRSTTRLSEITCATQSRRS